MLILLLTGVLTLLGGGGNGGLSVAGVESRIIAEVTDAQTQADALAAIDALEASLKDVNSEVEATLKALNTVHRRHDARLEDYSAVFAPLNAVRQAAGAELLATRQVLRQTLSRREWEAVFAPDPDLASDETVLK